ncbi:MAG: helix-turn-helix transcriptional regulator [Ruminococcaceae bacterium]|nr:helix-turn-helix transcriptional regulator [Oscillospiraceae bacterium]
MSNLKRIRVSAGLSQTDLATRSGVSVRMIQHYEQGAKDINRAQAITLYQLARVLNCQTENLIEIEEVEE